MKKTLVAIAAIGLTQVSLAQDSDAEIAKYRAALQDGNPAELWELKGEALWKTKRGSKNVSLETCDLGSPRFQCNK